MNNQQTPLEKLISDKERIQRQCKRQEQKLKRISLIYRRTPEVCCYPDYRLSFSLAISQRPKTNDKNTAPVTAGQPSIALGISDYLSIAKGMIPIAWDLAQPFIMTWGSKKAKKWFSNLLFKKRNNLHINLC